MFGKMIRISTAAVFAVSAFVSTQLYSQCCAAKAPAPIYTEMDINSDGKVTVEEYRAYWVFIAKKVDTNGDGIISDDEIKASAKEKTLQRDANKDGLVTIQEEMKASIGDDTVVDAKKLSGKSQFHAGDINKDDIIVVAEYRAYIIQKFNEEDANKDGKLSEEERAAAWLKYQKERDTNKDGKVTIEEFVTFWVIPAK